MRRLRLLVSKITAARRKIIRLRAALGCAVRGHEWQADGSLLTQPEPTFRVVTHCSRGCGAGVPEYRLAINIAVPTIRPGDGPLFDGPFISPGPGNSEFQQGF